MIKAKTFAVVGGGIGGLTAAIALRRKGFPVEVYENAPEFKSLGAGIVLAANAMKAFEAIGIEEEILLAGKQLKQFSIRDTQGRCLNTTEAEKINLKYGLVNTLTLHRADLHQVLLQALPHTTVISAKHCTEFTQSGDRANLVFADGTSAQEDYVIAADGIHSVFRKKLIPQSSLRYSGYTCWRAVVPELPDNLVRDEASETWGAGKRFGVVPLSDNRVYWYATINSPALKDKPGVNSIVEIQSIYADFHSPVPAIIGLTKQDQLIRNDISDFKPINQYAFDKVVLLGDAAHATTPNLGQGACMAIEDAVVLANCVAKEADVQNAFRLFESLRIGRATRIVNTSYSLGKIAQLENPFLSKLRNVAMRMTPESIGEKQLRFLYNISFT